MRFTDIRRELDITEGTRANYERWYRQQPGYVPPPGKPLGGWVDRW